MQWRIRVERHGTDDDRVDEVGAVGDAGEGIEAGRREQRVDVAAVARGAGDGDPGQGQRPGRVAQRAVGCGGELRQVGLVQSKDQDEQVEHGQGPGGGHRQLGQPDLVFSIVTTGASKDMDTTKDRK